MSETTITTLDQTPETRGERALYRKIFWRLVPLLFICYIAAYLDRVNVSFAKLQMMADLGFSNTVYGAGAGIFFIGYFFFEVPSNLLLVRIGARIWIARIMISWAIVSAAMIFTSSATVFYILRFLLGVCEAGFFPGVVFYLSLWFPSARRGAILASFLAAIPISSVIGSPVSGAIMAGFSGVYGLAGWQWLFLLEALPSLIMGVCILLFLDNRVEEARWLTASEKAHVLEALRRDNAHITSHNLFSGFSEPRVWIMSLVYFGIVMGNYGIGMWLPTFIEELGVKGFWAVGLWSALPSLGGTIAMLVFSFSSDRLRERPLHVAAACLLGAIGIAGSAFVGTSFTPGILFLTLAMCGIYSALSMFWTIPPFFLNAVSAAAGIAIINSIGNLAGHFGPTIIGIVKDNTGSANGGLYFISIFILGVAVLVVCLRRYLTTR